MKYLNHIQYIIDNYSVQIQARLGKEGRNANIDKAIDVLLTCDPTENKSLVDWLVKTYIGEGFKWEDVEQGVASKLAEVLGMYQTHFNQIPREKRNIYLYSSYGELYKLVEPYILEVSMSEETLGSREIRRQERARALEESEVLYRSKDIIIAVPLTEMASKWWGRGTKWCTAAENNNYFDEYNQKAPLVVITLLNSGSAQNADSSIENESSYLQNPGSARRGAEKFQLWNYKGNFEHQGEFCLMDSSDCEVGEDTVEKHWFYFEHIFEWLIQSGVNSDILHIIPEAFRTPELCLELIKHDGLLIDCIPSKYITPEICRIAIEQNGSTLSKIPAEMVTLDLCKLALQTKADAIILIADQDKTMELCEQAVRLNGNIIEYIPQRFRTRELYQLAVEQNGEALKYVPNKYLTAELCTQAIEQNGLALSSVPSKYRTDEIYKLAVEQNGLSIASIPPEEQTTELCMQAVKQDGLAIRCIHSNFYTPELFTLAVENNSDVLHFIPLHDRTHDMNVKSVSKNGVALRLIPYEKRNYDLCMLAVGQNADAIPFVPTSCLTSELILIALEENILPLLYAPDDIQTVEFYTSAINKNPNAICNVPQKYKTPEILAIAKNKNNALWDKSDIYHLRDRLENRLNDNNSEIQAFVK